MIERASTVLPDPDSPTMPRVCPRSTVEGDAVDGPNRAPAGAERGVEVLDHQERTVGCGDVGELEAVGWPAGQDRRGSQQAFADVEPLA